MCLPARGSMDQLMSTALLIILCIHVSPTSLPKISEMYYKHKTYYLYLEVRVLIG